MLANDGPIFIRGLSRSGGTLLVTMLDAHPDIAMSYELYPNLLVADDGGEVSLDRIIKVLSSAKNLKKATKEIADRGLRTFTLRCGRGGLDIDDIVALLDSHRGSGYNFLNAEGRIKFIESCCKRKMKREQKKRWGLKCTSVYDDYISVFPDAYFLNMIRDGRDVLASQLNTGSFNTTPEKLGHSWSNTIATFRKLMKRDNVNAYEVIYEKLVSEPRVELQKICKFLNVKFVESMLEYYKKDLTIYNTNHLSLKRISKPVDNISVGRWQTELAKESVESFCSVAGELMIEYGYLREK